MALCKRCGVNEAELPCPLCDQPDIFCCTCFEEAINEWNEHEEDPPQPA